MMRKIMVVLLCAMIAAVGFFIATPLRVSGDTPVSGHITEDTTWTSAESPYWIEGDLTIDYGVTLTIEPAVEVKFNGYYSLVVEGNLKAIGTANNRIKFTSNKTSPVKGDWRSIKIDSTGKCDFRYCDIIYGNNGIWSYYSSDSNFNNCNISLHESCGIAFDHSCNNNFVDCEISLNGYDGFWLIYSSNNVIENCNIINNYHGFYLYSSSNNNIKDCNISLNNYHGIVLSYSPNNRITCNKMWSNDEINLRVFGIQKQHFDQIIPTSNTINGRPIYYLFNAKNTALQNVDAGQITLAWCNNITLKNCNVTHGDFIHLPYTVNSILMNCNSSNNRNGIYFKDSSNNIIVNCDMYTNNVYGVRFDYSLNNTITSCDISSNYVGIYLEESSHNTVTSCSISSNDYGIYSWFSPNNIITKSNVSNNSAGLRFDFSPSNTIVDSYLAYNKDGILLRGSSSIDIKNNTIMISYYNNIAMYANSQATIHNNIIKDSTWSNIGVTEYSTAIIMNNEIRGSQHQGIAVYNGAQITAHGNRIHNNQNGIFALSSGMVTVANCSIYLNDLNGIYLESSLNNNITNCNIISNYQHGIYLVYSWDNIIEANNISNNGEYGLYLQHSSANVTHYDNERVYYGGSYWPPCSSPVYYQRTITTDSPFLVIDLLLNDVSTDLDMCLHYDANKDGSFNPEIDPEIAQSGNWLGEDEHITIDDIKPGTYFLIVNEFEGPEWTTFDLIIYEAGTEFKNMIFHNNIVFNTIQAYDNGFNQWNNGYPSGGNYWSDYTGVDKKSGPNQDQPGSDGIGDTPYNISGGTNKDRYPLMYPWGKPKGPEISVEKEFIPSEITTISQGVISAINITNIGDVNITSMTIIDEYVENMRPNDPAELLVTITSDEGEIYAIMPDDLDIIPTDSNITISFKLPLEVLPVFWENGTLQFGEETYYLESIPKDWVVGVQYLLYPIAELEMGTYYADVAVTAYSETGTSTTETATGMLTVSSPIELAFPTN